MLESRYPQWPDCRLHVLFERIATQFPDRPLILTDTHCWTYAEAARASRAVAAGLVALGVQPGDRVALIMANHPEFVIAKLAIARAGAVAVAINYLLREDELAYVLEQSGSRFVFAMDALRDRDYRPDLAAVLRRVEGLEQVILQGAVGQTGFLNFDALAAMASADDDAALAAHEGPGRADTLSDIVYTSGTTGRPKGVMLTHDMILRAGYSSALTRAFEDGRRVLFALPMYHVFGYVECFVAALFAGGAIIPQTVFDPAAMLDLADRHAATDMVCVPVMTHQLLEAAQARGARPAHLLAYFNSGGANVPGVWDQIRTILGPPAKSTPPMA
ncbi:AMP-binding protein [Novosphingobium colocasiae]